MYRNPAIFLLVLLPFLSCVKEGADDGKGGNNEPPVSLNWTVSGTVKGDDYKPIEGVVVSDGLSCVKTDAQGNYRIDVDLSGDLSENLRHVFVSTPKGWAAPMTDQGPVFWKWLKDYRKNDEGKITGVDFTLTRIANPDRFSILIFGDPQTRSKRNSDYDASAYHSVDICDDMFKDMGECAATMSDRPVYGIGLGDIGHRYPDFLTAYRKKMAAAGVICYSIIGNHDQTDDEGNNDVEMTDEESSRTYEKRMGPSNYSFNLGDLHFLILDNMIIERKATGTTTDGCITGLTDDIWTFAKNDLKLVPSTATIMVCAHSPMFRMLGGKDRSGTHLADLRAELRRFNKVYAWAGHTHTTFNYYEEGSNLEVHTMPRVTGALWTNEYLSENGTPRGYLVFDYDDGDIRWHFKPTFWQQKPHCQAATPSKVPSYDYRDWDYDASGRAVLKTGENLTDAYQMQVFAPGTYETGDRTVYANIFFWDEAWQMPIFQPKKGSPWYPMTRESLSYSWADRVVRHFYAMTYDSLRKDWYGSTYTGTDYPNSKKTNCVTMFSYKINSNDQHGKGTVKVTDRFGNVYTSDVTW